jgi:hypothetical protein
VSRLDGFTGQQKFRDASIVVCNIKGLHQTGIKTKHIEFGWSRGNVIQSPGQSSGKINVALYQSTAARIFVSTEPVKSSSM